MQEIIISIRAYCLTCIFLCAGFLSDASNADLFRIADSLKQAQQLRRASVEYERVGFYAHDNLTKTEALIRKAECLKLSGEYKDASQTLGRVNFANLPDTLIYAVRYQSALCSYLEGNFTDAESQLVQMHYFILNKEMLKKSYLLYSLTLNELREWEKARLKLAEWLSISGLPGNEKDSLADFINRIYDNSEYPELKNSAKAQKLSTFIPGAGQIYAGYTSEGIANVALQAAALTFAGYSFYIKNYITAFTLGTGLFQKFYFGGINRVDYLVKKRNYQTVKTFNQNLKQNIFMLFNTGAALR